MYSYYKALSNINGGFVYPFNATCTSYILYEERKKPQWTNLVAMTSKLSVRLIGFLADSTLNLVS